MTTDRGAGRIPWFGPAFSTKFLYFAQGSAPERSGGRLPKPALFALVRRAS
ncbi:hypothetical protein [Arthrobacter sp. ok909]|uniref:8-oxoguanine DNA glycosylase OGG fold protein n=1 Tax=Arthrobacter sp. ok909 TaxID=1761746 RepID=UPI00158780CD|nr:hypothetical protein [Arthrobacter sp. ok909]